MELKGEEGLGRKGQKESKELLEQRGLSVKRVKL